MKKILFVFAFFYSCVFLIGCDGSLQKKRGGAIVLGDSSLIVTETDPKYLTNNVEDFELNPTPQVDSPAINPPKDTVVRVAAEAVKPTTEIVKGLSIPFRLFALAIEDVEAREGRNINWEKGNNAAFTLQSKSLDGKKIIAKEGVITKVMQKTQTCVMLKSINGRSYKLDAMPSSTSGWKSLKSEGGAYKIDGLNEKELAYGQKFSTKSLRAATQKLARKLRMNRRDEQKLLHSIRNVRQASQAPCSIELQTVIWKISGKDANGKAIDRELRMDIPL